MESNHQPRAYETLALIPLELHSRFEYWKPAEELNLVPFRPTLLRFGLEDRRRERGPKRGGDGETRIPTSRDCLRDSRSSSWSYIAFHFVVGA